MIKAVVFGLLILLIGFVLWQLIVGEFFNPAEELAVAVNKENFDWFSCSSCGKLFMAEVTTRKGYCPYCKFQMMLVTEDKRVLAKSVNKSDFICFFSPKCGRVFFAYETKQMGICPYCAEPVDLTAPRTTVPEGPSSVPARLAAWTKANSGKLLLGSMGLFIVSVAVIYLLIENRTVLSLRSIEGAVSEEANIKLSKWQTRKKRLTLGDTEDDDIVLPEPSLKDIHYVLSFVRVGGKTHAYLSRSPDQPILINEKKQYNPRLHDHDIIKLGDVVFEVNTKDK